MRKLMMAFLTATTLAAASGAQAQATIDGTSDGVVVTPANGDDMEFSFGFAEAGSDTTFSEFITFTNELAGEYSFSLTTSTPRAGSRTDVDFDPTLVFLTGDGINGQLFLTPDADNTDRNEDYSLFTNALASGTYTLNIGGTRGTRGTFGGNFSFITTEGTGGGGGAVPEPGTWAMMLLGFGAAGVAMRRSRRNVKVLQLA